VKLTLAPLQTFTDFHFRNALERVYGGVDAYYAPYLKLVNDGKEIKENTKKDILPINNTLFQPIPQILACGSSDYFIMEKYIADLGYKEANWNMGCPYPMVTNKKMGAGMLSDPMLLRKHLEEIFSKNTLKLGFKMRMGIESCDDAYQIVSVLNDFPVNELIIHARFAKQLYTGKPNLEAFKECQRISKHTIVFNGDVCSKFDLDLLLCEFPALESIMIGRGAMRKPWLFDQLKKGSSDHEGIEKVLDFTNLLFDSCSFSNPHKGYALQKCISYWEYLSEGLEDGNKLFRKLKKAKDQKEFLNLIERFVF
jgi:tRNA-dihydrouridine synthase B